MNISTKLGAASLALALVMGAATQGFAETKSPHEAATEIAPRKYDRKIEAAAIRNAAQKIGELRGSVTGDLIGQIISEADLNGRRSSALGFPIITERYQQDDGLDNAVPMV